MQRERPVAAGRRIACLVGGEESQALGEAARAFSPWVELSEDGAVFFDVRGCGALHRSEEGLAEAVVEAAGGRLRIGIAGSKATARLAAEGGLGVIPSGRDREALAPLPVELLRPSPEAAETLRRWGIGTLGPLAALPCGEVALRLGAEGARLWELAAGQDDEPLVPAPLPDEPTEDVDLEFPLCEVEPLLFVLRGALDRLAARLAERGVVFGAVVLRLRLDPSTIDDRPARPPVDERWLSLAAPLRDVPAILALLRVSIESSPPAAAVAGLRVRAIPAGSRPGQLSLFEPAGPSPQKLAVTLARLAALVGPERVGTPIPTDAHRSAAPLPVRVLRPPLDATVHRRNGDSSRAAAPAFGELNTTDPRLSGAFLRLSGPWKLRSGWWSDAPVERDYYDAELSSGALVRLYRDSLADAWFVDGVYD